MGVCYCIANGSSSSPSVNYNLPISNAYISVNSQPMWVKFWILHLMTNPNKVYDTTSNLNHSFKSHQISTNPTTSNLKISTISNAYISNNSQMIWVKPILVKFWIINLMTKPNKPYDTTPSLD